MPINNSIVSVSWLNENLNNPELIILDARLGNTVNTISNIIENLFIPGSILIDIERDFSDLQSLLPHTMVNEQRFTEVAQQLGINKNSTIVVYDQVGIYASPRVWWMFLAMGFKNTYVLDGGFPAWKNAEFETSSHYAIPNT